MVLKRHFDEEGNGQSSKFRKAVKHVMREACLQELAEKIAVILEPSLRKVMREELEQHVSACFQSSSRRFLVHRQPERYPSRGLQLVFSTRLPSKLYTNSKIEDGEHFPLQILLVDANSKDVIRDGQLSSIKVEIVALNGEFAANGREDWSESEFNDNIVREREGKRPLLIGELSIVLKNGAGSLGNVCFTDNSSWIRSRKFKLGVRAVSSASVGTGIKEAVTDAFVVLDQRGEPYQKHSKPSLDDPVWRLRKISKLGELRKKLELHGIKTVKDFLMQYHINPSSLRHMLGKSAADRAWDTIVSHANDCHLDNTYYRYCGESETVELLFNCVYNVIAVKFTGRDYQTLDTLDIRQKALVEKLKQTAFLNLNEMVVVQSSPSFSPFEQSTIEHNIQFSSPHLMYDGFSIIDHDEPTENQLDFNLVDTASYPCTAEVSKLPEDDSASQTNQPVPVQWLDQSFMTVDSSSVPSHEGYNWYPDSPSLAFAHDMSPFGDLSHLQTAPWRQDDDLFSILTPTAHSSGVPFQTPDHGVSVSRNGSRKAGWSKIRAAVMWKIVRRNVVAQRKGKLPFCYYKNYS